MTARQFVIQMKNTGANSPRPKGFALVVTLSLMILLTLIAVGLLSLSSITLRSVSQGAAQAEARANARLALMLAIGELQKEMGPDQRVSASGAIVAQSDVKHPHWTGAWNSWKAGPEASGLDVKSEHSTIAGAANSGMAPTYQDQRKDHFRTWLLSLTQAEAQNPLTPSTLALTGTLMPGPHNPSNPNPPVELVGKGSLGSASLLSDFVSARLLSVKSKTSSTAPNGRYGWWVGDESQKARIMEDSYNSTPAQTSAEKIFRQQAPGSTGTTTVKGLEALKDTDDKQLKGLPSLQTVNLVSGATGKPAENFHHVTPYSYQVLADVREGGLKRDLSTLLERPISLTEKDDKFMLYKFNTKDAWAGNADLQESVPIHDLAAYYQLYDGNQTNQSGIDHSTWKEGVKYTSNQFSNAMQVVSPSYGGAANNDPAYFREYTTLYRQPVLLKVQFLLSMFAQPIPNAPPSSPSDPDPFTHYLRIGISPSVTFWNPSNIPMTMRFEGELLSQTMRFGAPPLRFSWSKDGVTYSTPRDLSWYSYAGDNDDSGGIFNLYFSGRRPITFEPGQVKTFSLGFSGDLSTSKAGGGGHNPYYQREFLFKTDKYFEPLEVFPGWEPESAVLYNRSVEGIPDVADIKPPGTGPSWNVLKIKRSDRLFSKIDGLRAGGANSSAFSFYLNQTSHQTYTQYGGDARWFRQHYQFKSRIGSAGFNQSAIAKGFPQDQQSIITDEARTGGDLVDKGSAGWPFMLFSLQAGVETSQASNGFVAAGRKFASRPFLHSSAIAPPFIDDITGAALYDAGWNWSVEPISDIFEVPVMVSSDDEGFYGGGNTPENGTTHVVQQEIPVVPPIALAALSHAHLGGFSLATQGTLGAPDSNAPTGYHFQNVTATGQGGIFPRTIQAIGNSYAHPNLAADKAYEKKSRTFSTTGGTAGAKDFTFADHSYLANKALWDEFFFSSISPQPSTVKVFGNTGRTAKAVADAFFFSNSPLPNRRITSYTTGFDKAKFDTMFTDTQQKQFTDGLADKIAAHLMVEGSFNINSTSVEAWKVMLSSLKGKSVTYLDKDRATNAGVNLDQATPDGVPVGPTSLPNGKPVKNSAPAPSEPDQWTNWRELRDKEIEELAYAIVRQVKLRGPFLSLSEFVNRRLEIGNLSVKGALQAALDDPDYPPTDIADADGKPGVAINAGFRAANRKLDSEVDRTKFLFPDAVDGPIAYGSAAYVDQADILRNLAEQLTPRGDTFVIRTYGDSLDASGKVQARAWCEAVVQRIPDYVESTNEPYIKQADPTLSTVNKTFGRKFQIVSFRWLGSTEV